MTSQSASAPKVKTKRPQQVKALRKPTVAVWLVNRLAREDELDIQRLLKAGESLTRAQTELARGQSPQRFLEARQEEQRALQRLTRAAHTLAAREGISSGATDRATATLRAAALTDEGRQLLKRGRLSEELQPPGFEALAGLTLTPSTPQSHESRKQANTEGDRRHALKQARDSLHQLRTEERELEKAARTAAHQADLAEAEARRTRQEADHARSQAEEAHNRVEAAEAELKRLRRRS